VVGGKTTCACAVKKGLLIKLKANTIGMSIAVSFM
jgi:hypothetical protein